MPKALPCGPLVQIPLRGAGGNSESRHAADRAKLPCMFMVTEAEAAAIRAAEAVLRHAAALTPAGSPYGTSR
jgi:hypothetical protein